MSQNTIQTKIEQIRNETQQYGNTRGRVADLLTMLNTEKLDKAGVQGVVSEILNLAPEFLEFIQEGNIIVDGQGWTEQTAFEPYNGGSIRKVTGYVGGVGAVPAELQSNVGKYLGGSTGYTTNKDEAINFNPSFITREYQSDNLLDFTTIITDHYVDGGGGLSPAAGWFYSDKIPATAGDIFSNPDGFAGGFYDANDVFLPPRIGASSTQFTAPVNAAYFRATGLIAGNEDKVLTKLHERFSQYSTLKKQTGQKTISKNLLPPSVLSRKGNNLVVSVRGGGDFRWINDALDWLRNSGENDVFNPFTFEIIDGEYVESVNMIGLYLSLIGRNKENCIIKNYLNDYYNPPVDMVSNNHLFNLTIFSDGDVNTPANGLNNMPSYGIHFDIASRYENLGWKVQGRSIVKNCRIIGKYQHAVGQGLWTNQYSEWDDCEFISHSKAAFRSHNYLPAGATNQQLFVRNCRFSNPRWNAGTEANPEMVNWAIMLQDANLAGGNENTDTVFTFQNNVAWCDGDTNPQTGLLYRHTPTQVGNVAGKIKLGGGSFGNNIPELNF